MIIKFTVPGVPCAKGRPKFATRGRFVQAYTPEKTVNYENLVKLSFMQQCGGQKLTGAIAAEILAFMPIPKSGSKKKKAAMEGGLVRHTRKPDADNLAKSILDALNRIAFDDDGQIVELTVKKFYAEEPRAEVMLGELTDNFEKHMNKPEDE